MDMQMTVEEILRDLHPEIGDGKGLRLVEDGILDSFDIVTLIASVRERLGVVITADKILPAHFDSVEAICALIAALEKEA